MNKKLSAAGVIMLLCANVFAENADRTKEMVVQAITGEFDHGAGVYVITKDVTITQGTL